MTCQRHQKLCNSTLLTKTFNCSTQEQALWIWLTQAHTPMGYNFFLRLIFWSKTCWFWKCCERLERCQKDWKIWFKIWQTIRKNNNNRLWRTCSLHQKSKHKKLKIMDLLGSTFFSESFSDYFVVTLCLTFCFRWHLKNFVTQLVLSSCLVVWLNYILEQLWAQP